MSSSNLSGWLLLKTKGLLLTSWKKRYFREADVVVFFSKTQGEAATDRIWLDQISSVTSGKDDGKFTIVLNDGNVLELDALSSIYKKSWMSVFGKHIKEHSSKKKTEVSRYSSLDSLHLGAKDAKNKSNHVEHNSSDSLLLTSRIQHTSFNSDSYNTIPNEEEALEIIRNKSYNNIPPIHEDDELLFVPSVRVIYNNIPTEQQSNEIDSPTTTRKQNHDKIPSTLTALSIVLAD